MFLDKEVTKSRESAICHLLGLLLSPECLPFRRPVERDSTSLLNPCAAHFQMLVIKHTRYLLWALWFLKNERGCRKRVCGGEVGWMRQKVTLKNSNMF